VVAKAGEPVVAGVRPGDRLLRVGRLEVAGATMGAIVGALRGKPGAARTLELERGGERLTVEAKVLRLP
jgi:C-terminal processing protease CtpA/Prc